MIKTKELFRWFKKGWGYSILIFLFSLITNVIGMKSIQSLLENIKTININLLLTAGVFVLVWGFVVVPVVSGFIIEFVNKKIK